MAGRITRFFVAVLFCTRGAFAAEVALFTDTLYVDYLPGSTFSEHEASNLEWEIDRRGDTPVLVDALGNIGSVALSRDTFVIPELEKGDLTAALSPAQAADIVNFVDGGGRLITFLDGNSVSLLNALFGFSLVAATPSTDLSLNLSGATGTPFDDYFANSVLLQNLTSGVTMDSLPAGGRAIYVSGDTVGVIAIARGKGWIIALGWDWYNPAPTGDLDGWRGILGDALDFARRMSRSAYISPSLSIPDNTPAGVTSEISDFPWSSDPLSAFTRMEVTVGIDHSYVGDLVMTLENDNGTSYELLNRPGPANVDLQAAFPLTFSNVGMASATSAVNDCFATNTVMDASCVRRLIPEQALPGGSSASFSDVWRLTVADLAVADVGQLVSWEISALREIPAAGVSMSSPSWQKLLTSEDGRSDSFTLVLNSKPAADVTIDISSSDTGEGAVSPASLTFTPANWNTPQQITATGVNDSVMDGNQSYTIVTAPAVSTDGNYSGLDADDVGGRNFDDEIDIYEGGNRDDTVDDARVILPTFGGFTQAHTLDNPGDVDWVKFYRDNYVSEYYFGIENFSASVSLVLEVMDTDGVTVLCSAIVSPGEFEEIAGGYDCISFNQVAIYYARVRAAAPFSGEVAQYEITFTTEGAFESSVYGNVTDSVSGQPVEAAVMRAVASSGTGGSYKLSNQNGYYSIDLFLSSNPLDLVIQREGYVSQTIPFTAPEFSSLNLDVQMVPATPPGITVTPTSALVTTEAGGTATFTVVLDSQPGANVAINLSSESPAEGTASPTSLVFTPTDWASPKTVTVTGVDDTEADGAQYYTIAFDSAISADSGYNGIYPDGLRIINLDDEPGIRVTPSDGLSTTEAGGTATFIVVLNSEPTAPVTFPLVSSNTDEGVLSTSSITFTPLDWNTPQSVTVTGVDDDVYDPSRSYWIIVGPATSTDLAYAGLNPADIKIRNTDDDENAPDYFELGDGDDVLENAPYQGIYDAHTLHSPDDEDWVKFYYEETLVLVNLGQEGTIVADIIVVDNDGATNVLCSFEAVSGEEISENLSEDLCVGNGLHYIRLRAKEPSPPDLVIPYFVSMTTSGAFEGAISGTVTDSVTHKPVAEVVVAHGLGSGYKVTNGDGRFGVNFNHGDTIPVTLDLEKPGYESRTVVAAGDYSPMFFLQVDVELVALPAPHIVVSPVSGLSTTESGGTAAFTVVLDSEPSASVTVNLRSSLPAEGTPSPTSLVFTPTNWDSPKTVTVTGVDDTAVDGDRTYEIILDPAISTDSRYNGVDPADVSVANEDDDVLPPAGVAVTPTAGLSTTEGGDTATFTVVLNSQPSANVTVNLRSSLPTEGAASPLSLVFTPADWASAKTVTVTGVDDTQVDGDRVYTIMLDPAVSTDTRYSGFDPADVSVTNQDDDVLPPGGIAVTPTAGLSTTEGGDTATFSVVLNSQPNANVTLDLHSDTPSEGTVSPTSLLFTPTDWDSPKTVTVTGIDDTVVDGDRTYSIILDPAVSTDTRYSGFDPADVSVTNQDNDVVQTAPDDIVVDFGTLGLWARMNDTSWLKLNNGSPDRLVVGDMDGNGQGDVVADFGSSLGGIYVKRNLGAWNKLHNFTAQALAVGDLDNNGKDDIVVDFGSIGLWARMNDAAWLKLSNNSPERVVVGDMDGDGADDVIADFEFTLGGLFVKRNLGGWDQLHNDSAQALAVGDLDNNGEDDVVIDFGGIGLWARMNDASWLKLHNLSPDAISTGDVDGNGNDDVLATFSGTAGLWLKQNLGGWASIGTTTPQQFGIGDVDGNGTPDIAADFGSGGAVSGLFVRRNQGGWSKLHNTSPEAVAFGKLD